MSKWPLFGKKASRVYSFLTSFLAIKLLYIQITCVVIKFRIDSNFTVDNQRLNKSLYLLDIIDR